SSREGNEPAGALGGGEETPGTLGSSGGASSSSGGADEACAATNIEAKRAEVDVIVIIDTSGSMNEETDQVKQNLNAFAQSIGNSGLDYNVIMIAEKPQPVPFMPPGFPSDGICVQPPLAGPNCGDG